MLTTDALIAATPTVLMWVSSGECSCKIEDYMQTDFPGITEAEIVAIAVRNGKVCLPCNKKANEEYLAQKASAAPFEAVISDLKGISNEAETISQSTSSQSSKSSGGKK
jgi:hypothetical protein